MAQVPNNSVEKIVRPFQVTPIINIFPEALGRVIIDPITSESESEAFDGLVFGGPNTSQFTATGVTGFKTSNQSKQMETTRQTSKKRISNPDDATQFVDVELIDKISFYDAQNNKYLEQTLNNQE